MLKIKRVAIVGGTHGDEFTGAYLIKKWEKAPALVRKSSFETLTLLANPVAFQAAKRYIDKDLNRCFTNRILQAEDSSSYEEKRAHFINQTLGPKGNPKVDFILDLHSIASNVGINIVLMSEDPFSLRLAASLTSVEPSLKIYSHAGVWQDNPLLISLCNQGFAIEVGSVCPGTLSADLFQKTESIVHAILDYIDKYNNNNSILESRQLTTIYQFVKDIGYPRDKNNEIIGMVHPSLQNADYTELKQGDPLFLTFDGETIEYKESQTVYPVFIAAPGYFEVDIAMRLTQKKQVLI